MKKLSCYIVQPQVLNSMQKLELRVYRKIGVLSFRKFLFSLERFRHRQDGQTNWNYHMRTLSSGGAAAFESYLIYHSLLHSVSLTLLVILMIWKAACDLPWNVMDALAAGMCAVNLWCLMLQRYNWLRIWSLRVQARQIRTRRLRRRTEQLLSILRKPDALQEGEEDMAWVQATLAHLSEGELVCLGERDVPSLRRMSALLDEVELEGRGRTIPAGKPAASQPIDRLAEALAVQAQPCGKVERRVDWLQRQILPHRVPLLSRCAVVTENEAAEEAFSALFCQSAPEEILETLALLAAVLERLLEHGTQK